MTVDQIEATTAERRHHCEGSLHWIDEHFPALRTRARWRKAAVPLSLGYRGMDGHGVIQGGVDPSWFDRVGARSFLRGEVSDGVWLVGTQNLGSAEALIAMWRDGARRFWFVNKYVVFMAPEAASVGKTRDALDEALARWDRGDAEVGYDNSFEPLALAPRNK